MEIHGRTSVDVDDQSLLQRLRNGDANAFQYLFERYWKPLYTALLKRICDEADAQDVLQDLFVSLWVRRQQLPLQIDWEDYFYAALRNRAINYFQADQVRINYANTVLRQVQTQMADTADSDLLTDDLQGIIAQATDRMPHRVKEVFLLSYSDGREPREIAEQLSLSLQTVKNYLAEAKAILRQFLAHYPAELFIWLMLPGFPIHDLLTKG